MTKWKRISAVWCIAFVVGILNGCTPNASEMDGGAKIRTAILSAPSAGAENTEAETIPDINKIKSICELATLRCYYHNVAKSTKESGTGILHLGEQERVFWIEYTGIVEISFQAEMIRMRTDGEEITITLPPPRVTCIVDPDSWNEDSYVISKDQWIQKNPITAADQTKAIEEAQAKMKEEVKNNSALLDTAKQQAKELIENYVHQIGSAAGVEYHIEWSEDSLTDKNN